MAEVTALRNNALPYPVYGAPWTIVFPLLDADGDLVTGGAADTPDSEVSKNGDTFTDCTNEMAELATTSGMYYLTLTAAEMTADVVSVICKTATAGTKTTPIVLYPRKLVSLATGTSAGGAVGYITLAAASFTVDAQFGGCLCVATIDSNVEARVLQVCTQADQQCTVTPAWNVAPDADDTYVIYLPEGRQMPTVDATAWKGVVLAAADTAGYPKVTIKDGTGTGELDTTSGRVGITGLVDASAAKLDDILDGTGGTGLTLNSLAISGNAAGGVVDIDNTGGPAIKMDGTTYGVQITSSTGKAIGLAAATQCIGMASVTGDAVTILTAGGNGDAISLVPNGTGKGINGTIAWTPAWDAEVQSECNDALVALALDHLLAVADADDVVNDSVMGKIAATDGDWSNFSETTDSLQSIRDVAPHGSTMVGTNGANTTAPDAAGTAAGLHGTTDGLIAALNNFDGTGATLAVGAITAAVFAANSIEAGAFAADAMTRIAANVVDGLKDSVTWTAAGAVDFKTVVKCIYAMARGKFTKAANVYTFLDDDDTTTLFTLTIADGGRTVA